MKNQPTIIKLLTPLPCTAWIHDAQNYCQQPARVAICDRIEPNQVKMRPICKTCANQTGTTTPGVETTRSRVAKAYAEQDGAFVEVTE